MQLAKAWFIIFCVIALGVCAYSLFAPKSAAPLAPVASTSMPDATSSTPPPPTPEVKQYTVIASKTVALSGANAVIEQRCAGSVVKDYPDTGLKECVGSNQLAMKLSDGEAVIETKDYTKDDAPLLMTALVVPAGNGVLISYDHIRQEDIGAGMEYGYPTWLFDLKSKQPRAVTGWPKQYSLMSDEAYLRPMWNASGTKAIFLPNTCGGAGCDMAPLVGYDLTADSSKTLTIEKAAPIAGATDPIGNPVPSWSDVSWTDDSHFVAMINNTGSADIKVKGGF